MSTPLLTHDHPIQGVPDGKGSTDPNVRLAWLAQRRGGLTATEARDWGNGSKRRQILDEKVNDAPSEDLSHIPAVRHGNIREPAIATWIESKFGIAPCEFVYSHGVNHRWLASPDGVSLDPFSKELIVGTEDALISEIKTSKHDLHPGKVDAAHVLIEVDPNSHFARSNYYTQMQWQMLVMNATMCLFVWEQHTGQVDPETDTFTPAGPPQWAWIPRDEALIQVLANELAPKALQEIDAQKFLLSGHDLPPAAVIPSEHAILMADLFAARKAEAIAKKAKEAAWAALQASYFAEGAPDTSIEIEGFGKLTVSTSQKTTNTFDRDAALRRAPKIISEYERIVKRYTKPVTTSTRTMTITEPKASK